MKPKYLLPFFVFLNFPAFAQVQNVHVNPSGGNGGTLASDSTHLTVPSGGVLAVNSKLSFGINQTSYFNIQANSIARGSDTPSLGMDFSEIGQSPAFSILGTSAAYEAGNVLFAKDSVFSTNGGQTVATRISSNGDLYASGLVTVPQGVLINDTQIYSPSSQNLTFSLGGAYGSYDFLGVLSASVYGSGADIVFQGNHELGSTTGLSYTSCEDWMGKGFIIATGQDTVVVFAPQRIPAFAVGSTTALSTFSGEFTPTVGTMNTDDGSIHLSGNVYCTGINGGTQDDAVLGDGSLTNLSTFVDNTIADTLNAYLFVGNDAPVPNNTGTITFANSLQNQFIYTTSGTAIASATITLPTASAPNQTCTYATKAIITSITMAGGTVDIGSAPTSAVVGNVFIWKCTTSGHWARTQ